MTPQERKDLVKSLLSGAKDRASKEIRIIREAGKADYDFLYLHIRNYVLAKYLLPGDCPEEDLTGLASLSLARTMKLDQKMIRELDTATPCDHATSESTKKILLLYALQKDLEIHPDPKIYAMVSTLGELTSVIQSEMEKKAGEKIC